MNEEKFTTKASKFFSKVGIITIVVVIAMGVKHLKGVVKTDKKVAEAMIGYDSTVSAVEISSVLSAIGEFATAEYSYSGQAYIEKSRKILGWKIPLTEHSISVSYEGTIKFGYAVDDMEVEVNGKTIIITLPQVQVLDNYIVDYKAKEDNNMFNPISSNEIPDKLAEVKELELEKADEKGAYKLAAKNVKLIISDLLGRFEGYNVVFH